MRPATRASAPRALRIITAAATPRMAKMARINGTRTASAATVVHADDHDRPGPERGYAPFRITLAAARTTQSRRRMAAAVIHRLTTFAVRTRHRRPSWHNNVLIV